MISLMDMTLRDFIGLLASNEPAPGGGSTAALSGVLGTVLSMMVVNISTGKKSYDALEENIKQSIKSDYEAIQKLKEELTTLVDEDTKAFNRFMEAMKLPKDTEEDRIKRSESMQKASLYTLQIPLKVAEKCLSILKHQMKIACYGNKNAVSDVGVGVLLAAAGLEGAALNVKINLPGITDEAVKSEALEKIEVYLIEGQKTKTEIMEIVNGRISSF